MATRRHWTKDDMCHAALVWLAFEDALPRRRDWEGRSRGRHPTFNTARFPSNETVLRRFGHWDQFLFDVMTYAVRRVKADLEAADYEPDLLVVIPELPTREELQDWQIRRSIRWDDEHPGPKKGRPTDLVRRMRAGEFKGDPLGDGSL